jgi:hypothetical protein
MLFRNLRKLQSCREAWLAFFRGDSRDKSSSLEVVPVPVCWRPDSEGVATLRRLPQLNLFEFIKLKLVLFPGLD